MTGGQTHEGGMTPVEIAKLLDASGVRELALVTDDLTRHDQSAYPAGVAFITGLNYSLSSALNKQKE